MARTTVSITSTTAVLAVDRAKAEWQTLLLAAYEAVVSDREAGASITAIGKAWKAAGITPNSNDTVGAYARTHVLTSRVTPVVLWAAIAETHGGATREPHAVVLTACQVRGVDYVDAVLTSFADAVDAMEDDETRDPATLAALTKAIRALTAKPRAAKTDDGSKGGDEGGEGDEETTGDEGDETRADEPTASDRLAALLPNLGRVVADWEREGHAPNAETVEAFLVLARRVNTLKRDRAADMAQAV